MSNQQARDRELDRLSLAYVEALDADDFDAIEELWLRAADEPDWAAVLQELSRGLIEEAGLDNNWEKDAVRIHALAAEHFAPPLQSPGPLTAGDVAVRVHEELICSRLRLGDGDRRANDQLLRDRTPLPEDFNLADIRAFGDRLGVVASDRYWKAFHLRAIHLVMTREQQAGRLAAARRSQPKKSQADESEPKRPAGGQT